MIQNYRTFYWNCFSYFGGWIGILCVFLQQIVVMIKLVLIIVVGFLVYNWYLKPLLNPPSSAKLHKKNPASKHNNFEKDDEYIDYEELKK